MAHQLRIWEGKFGKDYTDRCVVDWRTRLGAFRQMLEGLPIKRVLEVGCNRGHNLRALVELLEDRSEVVGVEPNQYALELARATSVKASVLYGHAHDLPSSDEYYDLVFTSGVLIHIPLADLPAALSEIYRVSKRYILVIEYFAEEETVIHYRGQDDLLWKRDFPKHYLTQFPDLSLIRSGHWRIEDGFANADWCLLEKPSHPEIE
jgi:pseudaminic acid biosynthesis-associated methylase